MTDVSIARRGIARGWSIPASLSFPAPRRMLRPPPATPSGASTLAEFFIVFSRIISVVSADVTYAYASRLLGSSMAGCRRADVAMRAVLSEFIDGSAMPPRSRRS